MAQVEFIVDDFILGIVGRQSFDFLRCLEKTRCIAVERPHFEFYFGRLQKFDIVAIEHQIGHERIENEIIQLSSTECHEQGSSLFERKRHVEFDMFHTY